MTVKYTNRKGETYYLKSGKTKTGKVLYNFVKNGDADGLVDLMPEGFEVTESVNAKVNLRKVQEQAITDAELFTVGTVLDSGSVKNNIRFESKGESIVIYEAQLPDFSGLSLGLPKQYIQQMEKDFLVSARYEPVVKFELICENTRTFLAFRMCYRGREDWMELSQGKLQQLCDDILPHIGNESFYELI